MEVLDKFAAFIRAQIEEHRELRRRIGELERRLEAAERRPPAETTAP